MNRILHGDNLPLLRELPSASVPLIYIGTMGEAAAKNGRHFLLIDESPEAVAVMRRRLTRYLP